MNWLEWLAAVLGVVNVALVVRRSVWNYPFALAMVSLSFFVFLEQKLYSDMLLQLFFFAVNLYGWWNWTEAKRAAGQVPVTVLSNGARAGWVTASLGASLLWGLGMARFTDAAAPFWDATIAGLSIAGQILMARRRIENWAFWIAVDAIAVPLFWSRGLHYFSGLYLLLLILSIAGLLDWRRAFRAQAKA
jgi:nicotinamide mononucleotide transporter